MTYTLAESKAGDKYYVQADGMQGWVVSIVSVGHGVSGYTQDTSDPLFNGEAVNYAHGII